MSTRRRRHRKDPIPVSTRLAKYRGVAGSGGEAGQLQHAWPEVAGAAAAKNTVVVRVSRAGVASVACTSAMWAQELDLRRDLLLDRLRRAVPTVGLTGLRFVVGDHAIPADTGAAPPPPTPPRPTVAERAAAGAVVADVSDPVLRDLLERAAAAQMAMAREKSKSLQIGKKSGRADRRS